MYVHQMNRAGFTPAVLQYSGCVQLYSQSPSTTSYGLRSRLSVSNRSSSHPEMKALPGSSADPHSFSRASCCQLFNNVFQPLTPEKSQLPYTQFRRCLLFKVLMQRSDKRGRRPSQLVNQQSEDLKTKKHKDSPALRDGTVPTPVT